MILSFSVENFRAIGEAVNVSFRGVRDDMHPGHLMVSTAEGVQPWNTKNKNKNKEDKRTREAVLKSVVIFGPNAAGKSTFIRALALVRDLVMRSASKFEPYESLPIQPYKLDPQLRGKPSRFVVKFVIDGVRFLYGLSASREEVKEEWLHGWPNGKKATFFHRRGKEVDLGGSLRTISRAHADAAIQATRSNALFLSTAKQFQIEPLTPIIAWFRNMLVPELYSPNVLGGTLAEHTLIRDTEKRKLVTQFLRGADLGIQSFVIKHRTLPGRVREYIGAMSSASQHITLYDVLCEHRDLEGRPIWIDLSDESRGTQQLFHLSLWLIQSVLEGRLILLDESTATLHTTLLASIVQWFHTHDTGGQILMASHDTHLLDHRLFRRDQLWFMDHDNTGLRTLSSLQALKGRKDIDWERLYLSGRIGSLPRPEFCSLTSSL